MNHGLLLLFLLTSCWLYLAAFMALTDWRWNAGRLAQSLAFGALGAWLLISGRTGAWPVRVMGGFFGATFVLPLFLNRAIRGRLLRGRIGTARFLHRIAASLTWARSGPLFAEISRIDALIRKELADPAARRTVRTALTRIHSALSRAAFYGAIMDALTVLRHYDEAVALHKERFGNSALKADDSILYTLAMAYAEQGRSEEAIACIQRARETERQPAALDLRPFMACVRVFALNGRVEDVNFLFERNARLAALLPPAHQYFWRGMALLRAGQAPAAGELFEKARALLRPCDELLRKRIEGLPDDEERVPALTPGSRTRQQLDALRRRIELAPASPIGRGARWHPLMTYSFIAATLAVWLLTESFGSSTDARTLLRFGANMPALVLHGQWWRLVSSIFLHVGVMHLLFNAYACFLFGTFVERMAGRRSTFTILILSGVGGGAASAFFSNAVSSHTISAGASGAIFGLLGAAIVIVLRLPRLFTGPQRRFLAFNLIFIGAVNMAFGFLEPNIDNLAHAGGFLTGVLCGLVFLAGIGSESRGGAWRLAAFLSVILLASSAVGAGYNLWTGGYPRRLPPAKDVAAPDGSWRVYVPAFWETATSGADVVTFQDPLGPSLRIQSGRSPALLLPREGRVYRRTRRIGGREFREFVISTRHEGRSWTRLGYVLRAKGRSFVLAFDCSSDDIRDYIPLFQWILLGFEPLTPE